MNETFDNVVRIDNAQAFRLPLDHPEIEQLVRRMDALFAGESLRRGERPELMKMFRALQKCDQFLTRFWGERPLPSTDIRPSRWNDGAYVSSPYFGMPQTEVCTGYVLRVSEHLEKLECQSCERPANVESDDAFDAGTPFVIEKPVMDQEAFFHKQVEAMTIKSGSSLTFADLDALAELEVATVMARCDEDEI